MTELQPELLQGFERPEQVLQRAGEGTKTIALIERLRALVLGIDDERVDGKHMHDEARQ